MDNGNHSITASFDFLVNQAATTIDFYIEKAPKEWTIEQKLKYAELCLEDYINASQLKVFGN